MKAPRDAWGRADFLVPRLSSSTKISVTTSGEALSVLFDDAQITLDAKRDGLDGWWTAGVALPVQPRSTTKFVCHLRAFVRKTRGARAVLVANVAGQLATAEYPYGADAREEVFMELKFDAASLSSGRVVVVVIVQAERQTLSESVTVALDSADAFKIAPERRPKPTAKAPKR